MSGNRILVIDDEPSIGEVVSLYLEQAGYSVTVVRDGYAALDVIARTAPDLVVVDLMLPGIDGLEITKKLRAEGNTPIIMLTARAEEVDRIVGLELGADDYVTKPFSPRELVSRVKAVLRRTQANMAESTRAQALNFGYVRIDPHTRQVWVRNQEVALTVKEFDLLWTFATHPQQVFNRDQLLDKVWGLTEYVDPSTVTVHVRRLREKIEIDPSSPRHIQTVWGVGYRFDP